MANSPDPRFRSAAIFAADGVTLKKVVQPQLKPLGWKSAGGWRGFEHRMFQLRHRATITDVISQRRPMSGVWTSNGFERSTKPSLHR
jgi:hypothetical protein